MADLTKTLQEIRERVDAAIEWNTTYSDFSGAILVDNENPRCKTHLGFECPEDIGKLMAHARTDIPMLLELVEETKTWVPWIGQIDLESKLEEIIEKHKGS